jgi:hypothetical protein
MARIYWQDEKTKVWKALVGSSWFMIFEAAKILKIPTMISDEDVCWNLNGVWYHAKRDIEKTPLPIVTEWVENADMVVRINHEKR